MKFITTVSASAILAALLLAAPRARAQTYQSVTLYKGSIESAVATNLTAIIDCRGNRQLSFSLQAAGTDSTTATVTAHFVQSPDTVTYSTVGFDVVLPLNNTTTACITTNADVGAAGFWKLAYVTNAAAVPVTNVVVQVALKPGQ